MKITVNEWDARFSQQAGWTQKLRKYIYNQIGLNLFNSIIEIGCGTGAVLNDFKEMQKPSVFGLDISEKFIRIAQRNSPKVILTLGDANSLPYKNHHFDAVLCHFFLLWVSDPVRILREMKRIVRKNGILLILAEPDYDGRIDFPDELSILGDAQIQSLIRQGANPYIGRRLGSLFHSCGISLIEMGVLGGQWNYPLDNENGEWEMLLYDLSFLSDQIDNHLINLAEIERLRRLHIRAENTGTRVLFVPTFYAWGQAS